MAKETPVSTNDERAQVEQAYGQPIPDRSWEYLVDKQYAQEMKVGLSTAEDLARELRELNQAAPQAIERASQNLGELGDGKIFESLDIRADGLANMIALRARRNAKVLEFRRSALNDDLIPVHQLSAWISDNHDRSVPTDWQCETPRTRSVGNRVACRRPEEQHREVEWIDDDVQEHNACCVPDGGILAALADLAVTVAHAWDWHLAYGTQFLLCDSPPPRPAIRRASESTKRGWDHDYGSYSLRSVRLTIDLEVTPEELAAWWRRKRIAAGASGHRPLADESVDLALFAVSRDEATTWKKDCHDWNSTTTTGRTFDDWRNYRTAAIRALRLLNHPTGW